MEVEVLVGFFSLIIYAVTFHFFHPVTCDSPPGGPIMGISFPGRCVDVTGFHVLFADISLNCNAGLPGS